MSAFPWSSIDDFALPTSVPRDALLDALFEDLAAPSPAIRDDQVFPIFATWIGRGDFDSSLVSIGDRLAAMHSDPSIQGRTFATLILGWTLRRASLISVLPGTIAGWRSAFDSWWLSETDLRGYDHELGWLHAIAHGADTVRAFALVSAADDADLQSMLALVVTRLLTPTDYLFAAAEDERLAYALAIVLSRPALDDLVSWLEPVAAAFAAGEPGPVPACISNTQRTLNALYVAVHRGVVFSTVDTQELSSRQIPQRQDLVLSRISDILRDPSYWLA